MPIFFEVIKVVFFISSMLVALFTIRGYYYLPDATFTSLNNILLPGYLLITGLMIGYVYVMYLKVRVGDAMTRKQWVTGFLFGLSLGILMAMVYVFFH